MEYGYARCSTNDEKQDVDRQLLELEKMGATVIFKEYIGGTKKDRPEFDKLLAAVVEGDTIYTTEVSRISRSTKHLCEILEIAKEKKLRLVFGSLVVDCRASGMDAITECLIKLLAVIAEFERNLTVERVKSGLKAAKAKGVTLGRPVFSADKIPRQVYELYPVYQAGEISKKDYAAFCGISRPTLNRYIAVLAKK